MFKIFRAFNIFQKLMFLKFYDDDSGGGGGEEKPSGEEEKPWHSTLPEDVQDWNETKEAKDHLLTAITTHSVISWAHINLLGEYDFSDEKLQDSVGILPPKLAT